MNDRTTRAALRALANIHRNPPVTPLQLRKSVLEMAAEHLPEAYIRLFVSKAKVR